MATIAPLNMRGPCGYVGIGIPPFNAGGRSCHAERSEASVASETDAQASLSMTKQCRSWLFQFIIGGGHDQSAPTVCWLRAINFAIGCLKGFGRRFGRSGRRWRLVWHWALAVWCRYRFVGYAHLELPMAAGSVRLA